MPLTHKEVQALLEWWSIVRARGEDTSADWTLAERLETEMRRLYELEHTR